MSNPKRLATAKVVAICGFLALLSSTYYLRSEVLTLNKIGFSSDHVRAEYKQKQVEENFPRAQEQFKVAKQNYELQMEHYEEMLDLYQTDKAKYLAMLDARYRPPQLPDKPEQPQPPEYTRKLMRINKDFRAQKHHYFETTSVLNSAAMAAAMCLVGGVLYLIMFETNGRFIYFATLVLSFAFMIGPSFHSIMSAIVGFLDAPRM